MARAGWFLWEKFLVVMVGTGAERVGANIVRPQNHAAETLLPGNTGTSGPAGQPSPSEEGWEILPQQIRHAL